MTKKEIDGFLYKVVEIKSVNGFITLGQIVPSGNGYLVLTIYGDYPELLEASHIKDIRLARKETL